MPTHPETAHASLLTSMERLGAANRALLTELGWSILAPADGDSAGVTIGLRGDLRLSVAQYSTTIPARVYITRVHGAEVSVRLVEGDVCGELLHDYLRALSALVTRKTT